MIKHNKENCLKLATFIVDGMDMDDLINYIKEGISHDFEEDKKEFFQAVQDYGFDPDPSGV